MRIHSQWSCIDYNLMGIHHLRSDIGIRYNAFIRRTGYHYRLDTEIDKPLSDRFGSTTGTKYQRLVAFRIEQWPY